MRVPAALAGERVDRVVAMVTGLPRAEVALVVSRGGVRLNESVVTTRSRRVEEGDELDVDVPARDPGTEGPGADPTVDVPVVFIDEHVIVVDKPPGLVVHPGAGNMAGTMVSGLLARYPDIAGVGDPERPGVVHRLDKGTSGLLVVARSQEAYASLVAQLGARSVERRYLTMVWGVPTPSAGMVDAPIGRSRRDPTRMAVSADGRDARTLYEVRQRFREPVELALVECRLQTGRTHQIRVHLAAIGHPVVGDGRYGGSRASFPTRRPFLHAHALAFEHPARGERLSFTSALAPDLAALVEQLR